MKRFLELLNAEVQDFNSKDSRENGKDVEFIKKTLHYNEQDIKKCSLRHHENILGCAETSITGLDITDYPTDINEVKRSVVLDTLEILATAGVVETPKDGWVLEDFVDTQVAKVV